MRTILAATDLSSRSDAAIHRAALLAKQFGSTLILLHVIDDDQPREIVDQNTRRAGEVLGLHADRLAESHGVNAETIVKHGTTFEAIIETSRRRRADLIVMGTPRQSVLRDVFVGTTVERVMRAGETPVLMANILPSGAYGRALLATDMSPASARAAHVAKSLGLIEAAKVSVVHAFRSHTRGMLGYIGADHKTITRQLADEALAAGRELQSFLNYEGLGHLDCNIILERGDAGDAIVQTVERLRSDILVLGTRGEAALRRILLGSLAADILRRVQCDVLAVPPDSLVRLKEAGPMASLGFAGSLDPQLYELGI